MTRLLRLLSAIAPSVADGFLVRRYAIGAALLHQDLAEDKTLSQPGVPGELS